MFFQYRNGKLIADNVRPDDENFKFMAAGEYDKVFTDWQEGDILYVGNIPLNYPIEDNGEMREMTDVELVKGGIRKLLAGECIVGDEIIIMEIPSELLKPVWNFQECIWEEGMAKEDFIELRKNKILEYSKLEDEKRILEGSKFPIDEEIKAITERMAILEVDINNLQEKIKAL